MNKVLDKKDAVFVKRNDPELNYGQTGTFVQINGNCMFQPDGPLSEGVFEVSSEYSLNL